jgi:hypothetical protein
MFCSLLLCINAQKQRAEQSKVSIPAAKPMHKNKEQNIPKCPLPAAKPIQGDAEIK